MGGLLRGGPGKTGPGGTRADGRLQPLIMGVALARLLASLFRLRAGSLFSRVEAYFHFRVGRASLTIPFGPPLDSRYPTRRMSFLDNLESNLKALEARDERDPATLAREAAAREATRSVALQIAPYAEALRNGPFLDGLLTACQKIGHSKRILVRPVWVDSTLRLEAGAKKLELRPTPVGVVAVFFEGGREIRSMPIDLASDPVNMADTWLD